jgi:CubicO group peptidase (beta-lactamase class C family)
MDVLRALALAGSLLLCASAPAWAQPRAKTPPAASVQRAIDPVRLEAFVDGAVDEAMRAQKIAGVSVAIVDRQGPLLAKGYGMAGPGRPANADTLFRVGSISKTGVWIALMQLVEQGKIKLDDPVNDHLPPALRIPEEGFRQPILIRHLMTHSPGFEDSALGHLFLLDPRALQPLDVYLQTHRVHRVRPAGEVAVYSNYGAALAGAIVAQESHLAWQDYAEQRIFRPLGMQTASYREPYPEAVAAARGLPAPLAKGVADKVSAGYLFRGGRLDPMPWEYVSQVAPAGALSASANDMTRYMAALLDPDALERAGVLRSDTAREMREPMLANHPDLGAWRHGFMTFRLPGGRIAFGHGGDLIYQHAIMIISPDLGVAIFAAVNTPSGVRLLQHLPQEIIAHYFGDEAVVRAALPASESAQYAGTYRVLRRPYFRTEAGLYKLIGARAIAAAANGDLVAAGADGVRRFVPVAKGLFQAIDGPERLAFAAVNGRMRAFDFSSTSPADRIGFFETANWLFLILSLAGIVGLWGVISGLRRAFARAETPAALIVDALAALWLVAIGAFATALTPWLADQSAVVFAYPGQILPTACWLLLAAAIATPAALLALLFLMRPKTWSAMRWTRAGAALAVFAAASVTLQSFGLLGFSGW